MGATQQHFQSDADPAAAAARARNAAPTRGERRGVVRQQRLVPRTLTARDRAVEEVGRVVDCPYEPGETYTATFNRRTDLLEYEKAHERLSEQQYLVGRQVQEVLERARPAGCGGGWSQGDRVDAELSKEITILRSITSAHEVRKLFDRIRQEVGPPDADLLRDILGERQAFADVAAQRGGIRKHDTSYYARRFRDALETLVEAFAARGSLADDVTAWRADDGPPVATDANGIQVAPGHGFTVGGEDGTVGRWRMRSKTERRPAGPRELLQARRDRDAIRAGRRPR